MSPQKCNVAHNHIGNDDVFYWHTVPKWRFMQVGRNSPETLCIPLEAAPPYCNFLSEPYLEQPETALQQSLATLLLTCCHFITVSISLCLFCFLPFSLHASPCVQCHARYTEKSPPRHQSLSPSVSHLPVCHQFTNKNSN